MGYQKSMILHRATEVLSSLGLNAAKGMIKIMKKSVVTRGITIITIVCMMFTMMSAPVQAAGSNNGNGNGDDPHVKISFNTDGYTYDEELDAYVMSENMLMLSGTLEKTNQVKSFTYEVCDEDGISIQFGNISITDAWTISDICLSTGLNTVTMTATRANGQTITESIRLYYNSVKISIDMSNYT